MTKFKTRKINRKHLIKNILSILLIIFLVFVITGIFSFSFLLAKYNKSIPDPNKLIERTIAQSTKIYDKTGKVLLYEVYGDEKRTIVELDQISKHLIDATIAIEDKDFYKHPGFNIKGILRAVIKDILLWRKAEGGSTLTQQLVKNAILTKDKAWDRKIKELILSYKIEKRFDKDDILKMYLNEIPYGSVIYGIESASQTFFNKSAKDLSISESALLAALPQSPSVMSPYGSNTERLISRQKLILSKMKEFGYISQTEYNEAIKENILSKIKPKKEYIKAPHFVMYVKSLLEKKYGEKIIEQGGLNIITTLDYTKQQKAEEIINKNMPNIEKNFGGTNAALLSLNAKNGEIEVMVGSKDYFNDKFGSFNVTINPRQVGSTFKPIVYAAAFKKGFTPDTILFDTVTNFSTQPGQEYIPKNYTLKEYGPVSIRKALAGSLNIPAVKTLYLTGQENVINLAREMGYSTLLKEDKDKYGLTLALGTLEAPLIDHVKAFSVFANDGVLNEIKAILKITDNKGNILEDNSKIQNTRILDKNIAREINSILSDNDARAYVFGKKNSLTLKSRPVAAKTGTTNEYKDVWTMGFTPNIVTGVWVGNNDNKSMKKAPASLIGAPIWQEFMEFSTKNDKIENFEKPIYENKPNLMLNGEWKNVSRIQIDRVSSKLATEDTPIELIEERLFINLHDILNYINKDDLLKEKIEKPENDPQYENWEIGVKSWFNVLINKQEKTKEEEEILNSLLGFINKPNNEDIKKYLIDNIPTEKDNIHNKDVIKNLNILSPINNASINSNQIDVRISYSSTNKITKVNYLVDGVLQDTITREPWDNYILNLINVDKGYHILEVQIFDEFLNKKSDSINFTQNLSGLNLVLNIENKTYVKNEQIPITLSLNNTKNIDNIKIFYELNNNKYLLSFITEPDTNLIKVILNPNQSGVYKIYAEIQKKENVFDIITSNQININVQ